jgi:hypothetical protein
LSKESKWGIFRTGVWYDWAYTDRYQIPSNILTQLDTPLGNFHEHFITQSTQPFAEFEWHPAPKLVVTVGVKDANYAMALNQYQDNGKTVGCLGGTLTNQPGTGIPFCIGGAAFVAHSIDYNNWLPNVAARYSLKSTWSVYAQWAEGSVIPPSAVFDVPNGQVLTPPKPTLAKTYQVGSVTKHRRWTLDADAYYVHFQNAYDTYTDPTTTESVFVATGPSNTKGIEAESNVVIGWGLSLYLNGTVGSAKYQEGANIPNGGLWVADTPKNVETVRRARSALSAGRRREEAAGAARSCWPNAWWNWRRPHQRGDRLRRRHRHRYGRISRRHLHARHSAAADPHHLLGQVDAAIGGKTGVNLASGKNLIGSFHQPIAVLIDPDVLDTLAEREYRAGLYEIIKAGIIRDRALFRFSGADCGAAVLARQPHAVDRIIDDSVRMKAEVVSSDEREGDLRRILNLGHTFGHALETETGYTPLPARRGRRLGHARRRSPGANHRPSFRRRRVEILEVLRLYGPIPPLDGIPPAICTPAWCTTRRPSTARSISCCRCASARRRGSGVDDKLVMEAIRSALA